MARGILGTVGLAATLVFAIPLAYAGVDFLLKGETIVGAAFVGIAAGLVLAEEYLTTPGDLPGIAARRAVGRVVKTTDEDDEVQ